MIEMANDLQNSAEFRTADLTSTVAMTNSRRYQLPELPLSAGDRIMRRCKQVGMALAIPIAVIGVWICVYHGYDNFDYEQRRWAQVNCAIDIAKRGKSLPTLSYDERKVDLRAAGCEGPVFFAYPWELSAYNVKPSFTKDFVPVGIEGSAFSIAVAAMIFIFFCAMGRIIAGFTRD